MSWFRARRCVHCGAPADCLRARASLPACWGCAARQMALAVAQVQELAVRRPWWSRLPALTPCEHCGDDGQVTIPATRELACYKCAGKWNFAVYTPGQVAAVVRAANRRGRQRREFW